MIRHVCLFRLERALSADDRSELDRFAAEIQGSLSGVQRYVFAINRSRKGAGFDLVLDSSFASQDELTAYVRAPIHEALATFMDGFVEQTIVADY